ncbi:MAG: outer membrane protein [Legionella sp.]
MKFALFSATLLASSIASAATPVNGWYASAFGGYAYLSSNVSKDVLGLFELSHTSYRSGFNAGARLGYQSNPIRYELEYTYVQANTKHFQINHISQTSVSGKAFANLGMVNLYYDFADTILPTISPFLGLGIGAAQSKVNLESTGQFFGTSFEATAYSFAYQGTAGLTYNFAENFALNASYRYLRTSNTDKFGRAFQAQLGDVGVVYRFDQCDYK